VAERSVRRPAAGDHFAWTDIMSTATLSSLIGVLILGQVAGFALVARHRYRGKFRALQTQAFGDRPGAPTHRITSDAERENQDNVDPDELDAFPSAWAGKARASP
jgi:hypothetical protein